MEPFWDLSLEFPERYHSINKGIVPVNQTECMLTEMLAKFTETEALEGRIYACDQCNSKWRTAVLLAGWVFYCPWWEMVWDVCVCVCVIHAYIINYIVSHSQHTYIHPPMHKLWFKLSWIFNLCSIDNIDGAIVCLLVHLRVYAIVDIVHHYEW